MIIAALVTVTVWGAIWQREQIVRWLCPLGSILAAAIDYAFLHNGHSIAYFTNLAASVEKRIEIASHASNLTSGGQASSEVGDAAINRGLGYLGQGDGISYPHNILLESFLETGAFAAILLALVFMLPLAMAGRQALRSELSLRGLLASGALTTTVLICLKSGDITGAGGLVFASVAAAVSLDGFSGNDSSGGRLEETASITSTTQSPALPTSTHLRRRW